jgi:hypothetical protein
LRHNNFVEDDKLTASTVSLKNFEIDSFVPSFNGLNLDGFLEISDDEEKQRLASKERIRAFIRPDQNAVGSTPVREGEDISDSGSSEGGGFDRVSNNRASLEKELKVREYAKLIRKSPKSTPPDSNKEKTGAPDREIDDPSTDGPVRGGVWRKSRKKKTIHRDKREVDL